jgi:ligand-binding SRPBCC domain-containing protein
MSTYSLKSTQKIPIDLDKAWDFFSDPANLSVITPDKLGFEILSKYHVEKMYPGQIIEYKIKPLFGVPVYWMTEITHVEDKRYFIDEQRFGPYQFWHHQHHFESIKNGVEMTDIVHYRNPLGFLGNIANSLFVKNQLEDIFEFRIKKVESIFGQWSEI